MALNNDLYPQITRTAERKDSELAELRLTIEQLRKSGADAGLIKLQPTAGAQVILFSDWST